MSVIVHRNPSDFRPPRFDPHPFFRGGHLQTIVSIAGHRHIRLSPQPIRVPVSDGDSIVLHEDAPETGFAKGSILLVHGLTGCHSAPYMIRLADRFRRMGMRVYRMDMRGFGAAYELSANLSHAGRSDDCMAALDAIAARVPSGPIFAVGISLGGGQLLRAMGRVGGGSDRRPIWFDRVGGVAVVSPPIDLLRCSDNMQRVRLRPYNRYFIRSLLSRIPPGVRRRQDFAACVVGPRPLTLRQLDDRYTAPLSGFAGAAQYYDASSACHVVDKINVPTLVLTASDDPIVPAECFDALEDQWSDSTELIVAPAGGHVGFIQRDRTSWMDEVLVAWIGGRAAADQAN